jgi:hypothetical protein
MASLNCSPHLICVAPPVGSGFLIGTRIAGRSLEFIVRRDLIFPVDVKVVKCTMVALSETDAVRPTWLPMIHI